jgi:hypothetical protein
MKNEVRSLSGDWQRAVLHQLAPAQQPASVPQRRLMQRCMSP